MPLSDHEEQTFRDIEQSLMGDRRTRRAKLLTGVGVALLGMLVLLAGAAMQNPPVGVGGFLLAFAGSWWAYRRR